MIPPIIQVNKIMDIETELKLWTLTIAIGNIPSKLKCYYTSNEVQQKTKKKNSQLYEMQLEGLWKKFES
jgi:hypothetical protein